MRRGERVEKDYFVLNMLLDKYWSSEYTNQVTAIKHFNNLRDSLVGMEVSDLWCRHGSAIFLEFGRLSPKGENKNTQGEITLMIEWSWRIEGNDSILCGSWSEDEFWEPNFKQLIGLRVMDLELFGRLPEITLRLTGDRYVVSFATSDGQPEWALLDHRNSDGLSIGVVNGQLNSDV